MFAYYDEILTGWVQTTGIRRSHTGQTKSRQACQWIFTQSTHLKTGNKINRFQ